MLHILEMQFEKNSIRVSSWFVNRNKTNGMGVLFIGPLLCDPLWLPLSFICFIILAVPDKEIRRIPQMGTACKQHEHRLITFPSLQTGSRKSRKVGRIQNTPTRKSATARFVRNTLVVVLSLR